MIINIRGTSGSGKTTVVRRVVAAYTAPETVRRNMGGKDREVGTLYHRMGPDLFVMGRYDATCGGCDTMSWKGAADDVMGLALEFGAKADVLFEGLMVSSYSNDRIARLSLVLPVTVVQLETPLEVCLRSIQERRDARARLEGKEYPPMNPTNTTRKHTDIRNNSLKLVGRVDTFFLGRDEAVEKIGEILKL